MDETNLIDVFRFLHKDKTMFTWYRRNPSFIACRLDFFLISSNLLHKVENIGASPGYLSDHSIIYLKLKLEKENRGPGFWKLNTSLLHETEYREKIKKSICEMVVNNKGT